MIYYFSATGNSCHVANRLAQSLNEQIASVLNVLGKPIFVEDRMILVYPNYCGGVPSVIREFLQQNIFQISKDAKLILVITYGNNTGASSSIATKYVDVLHCFFSSSFAFLSAAICTETVDRY